MVRPPTLAAQVEVPTRRMTSPTPHEMKANTMIRKKPRTHHVSRGWDGSTVAVGGQDCHIAQQGAHTGDVSAAMLRDAGASWVILGHSERRQNHGETDELIREKVLAAVAAKLTPIVCVGETEE